MHYCFFQRIQQKRQPSDEYHEIDIRLPAAFQNHYFRIGFNLFSTMPSAATMIAATIASMTPLKLMTPPMIPSTAPASTLRAFAYASLYNTKIPPITSIVLTIAPVTPA